MGHQIRPAPAAFSPACIPASLSRDPSRGRALGGTARTPGSPGAAGRPARDGPGTPCRCGHHGRQRRLQGPWASPSCSGHNVPTAPQGRGGSWGSPWSTLGAKWGSLCLWDVPSPRPSTAVASPCRAGAQGKAGACTGLLDLEKDTWDGSRAEVRKDMPGHRKAVKQAEGSSLCCHPSPPSTDVPLWSELNPTPLVKLCRRVPGIAAGDHHGPAGIVHS